MLECWRGKIGTEWNGMSSGIVAHVDFNMGIGPVLRALKSVQYVCIR